MIVETEAYLGIPDPASHAWRGRRNRLHAGIWAPAGTWYVYRSYGIHWCLNLTCGPPDLGAAVLIRGLDPVDGIEAMRLRRGGVPDARLVDGPGKLTRALAITGTVDGMRNVRGSPLRLEGRQRRKTAAGITVTPRIGISRAADWPLRWVLSRQG